MVHNGGMVLQPHRRGTWRALLPVAAIVLSLSATARTAGAPIAHPVPGAPNCPIFPATNVWNKSVAGLPVAKNSATLIASIGLTRGLHPDFGTYAGYGIPYNVVGSSTPKVSVRFQYASESDRGPYPIPAHP